MANTPYFVFDKQKLTENYLSFKNTCEKYFPRFKIAYSIKTNSFDSLLKELAKQKTGFECASLDEIKKAIKSNKRGFKVFNGPSKTEEELRIAVKNDFLINIDSKSEIDKIISLMGGKPINIGIRIVYNVQDSKFGFEEKKVKDIINYCERNNLNITCVQFHQGTQINIENFENGIKKFAKTLEQLGKKIDFIDIGGGFPDKFRLRTLGLKLDDYFEIIRKNLQKFNATIILEPGRALVCDVFELMTKVIVIKENFGIKHAILNAGTNFLPRMAGAFYMFEQCNSGKNENKKKEEYILTGPLLFANDSFGKFHGHLKEGDIIKVKNVGAYCYNLAWEISYKKPKIISKN